MATSKIKQSAANAASQIHHEFFGNDSYEFSVPSGRTALLLFNHPYGESAGASGAYIVTSGYTNVAHPITILSSNNITITKTGETTFKVTTTLSTFMTALW